MKTLKKNYPYILIFIFFLIITFLVPISGDDWGNYIEGSLGLKHTITHSINMYFSWEGRFISRLLITFLTYYKPLWNIMNSLLITSIIYLIMKIIKPKNKKLIFLTTTLMILLMNIKTFSETVVWVAGNITYLFVIPLLLFYFNYIINHKNNNKKVIFLLVLLNIIMTMFVEHMAVVLVAGNILILISRYIKTKKVDKEILLYIIASLAGLISMILSPGSRNRALVENVFFNQLSIIGKCIYNVPNFIYYTFTVNYALIILLTIANYYLIKQIKNKNLRIVSYLYLLIIPIVNSGIYLYKNVFFTNIPTTSNLFMIIYFISYILIDLVLIFNLTKKDKVNKILFFYLLGLGSNFVMLVSPTWGYRTSLATYIFLSISCLLIIERHIKENNLFNYTLSGITLLSMIFYITLYSGVRLQLIDNEKSIKEQLKENKEIIEVVKYPSFVCSNINPSGDYHIKTFKKYYNIDDDKEIKLIDNNWKYQIIYRKSEKID